jgi:hypothetical protein
MSVEALTQEISELKNIINELVSTHHAQMVSLHQKLFEISNDVQKEAVIRKQLDDKRFLDKMNNLGRHYGITDTDITKAQELIS